MYKTLEIVFLEYFKYIYLTYVKTYAIIIMT